MTPTERTLPYKLTLRFDELPGMNVAHTRRHWAVAHKEAIRVKERVWAASWGKRPQRPLERAHVVLTRHSTTEPDFENLCQSFKPWVDALKSNRIIVDDDPAHLTREYLWKKAPRGQGHITIEVTEGEGGR